MFHREEFAGTRKAGLHFIGNQQNPMGITQLTQRLHKVVWRDIKAAFALYRLE